jgi:Cysteine-rich CPXCG
VKRKRKRGVGGRRPRGTRVECPFCGEADDLTVDEGGGASQTYIEDCAVCCRPRVVHVEPGDEPGEVRVWLERSE